VNTHILVKQVSRYVYDIFGGVGYDTWTRVRKQHWGVVPVAGSYRPTRAECKVLDAVIHDFPQGSNQPIAL
jgi:hypothetical protein